MAGQRSADHRFVAAAAARHEGHLAGTFGRGEASEEELLRPPGALLPEERFLAACTGFNIAGLRNMDKGFRDEVFDAIEIMDLEEQDLALAAILLGPWAGMLVLTSVLAYLVLRFGEIGAQYAIVRARVNNLPDDILDEALDPLHEDAA